VNAALGLVDAGNVGIGTVDYLVILDKKRVKSFKTINPFLSWY